MTMEEYAKILTKDLMNNKEQVSEVITSLERKQIRRLGILSVVIFILAVFCEVMIRFQSMEYYRPFIDTYVFLFVIVDILFVALLWALFLRVTRWRKVKKHYEVFVEEFVENTCLTVSASKLLSETEEAWVIQGLFATAKNNFRKGIITIPKNASLFETNSVYEEAFFCITSGETKVLWAKSTPAVFHYVSKEDGRLLQFELQRGINEPSDKPNAN